MQRSDFMGRTGPDPSQTRIPELHGICSQKAEQTKKQG